MRAAASQEHEELLDEPPIHIPPTSAPTFLTRAVCLSNAGPACFFAILPTHELARELTPRLMRPSDVDTSSVMLTVPPLRSSPCHYDLPIGIMAEALVLITLSALASSTR